MAALRPAMAMSSDSIGPDTTGPDPVLQPMSVACNDSPAMRRLVPAIRFEPL